MRIPGRAATGQVTLMQALSPSIGQILGKLRPSPLDFLLAQAAIDQGELPVDRRPTVGIGLDNLLGYEARTRQDWSNARHWDSQFGQSAFGTMKKRLFPVASPRLIVNRSPNET